MQEREASMAIPPRVALVNGLGRSPAPLSPERVERDSIGRVDSDPNESAWKPSSVTRPSRSRGSDLGSEFEYSYPYFCIFIKPKSKS